MALTSLLMTYEAKTPVATSMLTSTASSTMNCLPSFPFLLLLLLVETILVPLVSVKVRFRPSIVLAKLSQLVVFVGIMDDDVADERKDRKSEAEESGMTNLAGYLLQAVTD